VDKLKRQNRYATIPGLIAKV